MPSKTKQNQVKAYLDVNNFKYSSCDKIINTSDCGLERPDFVFDCGTHFIILEVDEHQHKSYLCDCEVTRMLNIWYNICAPTIFIRFNPDEYTTNNIKNDPSHKDRMKELSSYLKYYMKAKVIDELQLLSVVYLYYDNYDKKKTAIQTLVSMDEN